MSASVVVAEYDAKLVTAESVEVPHNIQEAAAQEARNSGGQLLAVVGSHRWDDGFPGTSWYAAVFLVVNAALGAGLLNFPQAFDRAGGLAVALSVQAVLLLFVVGSLLVLGGCAERTGGVESYQRTVSLACGGRLGALCSLLVALYCYGSCVAFLVIVGDFSDRVFASWYGSDYCLYWYMRRDVVTVLVAVVLVLPLCFSGTIDFLKYPSALGVFAGLYLVGLVVADYYTGHHPPAQTRASPESAETVLSVVPVICFGYQCHVSSVPIYGCLAKRSTFPRVVLVAVSLAAGLYTLTGVYGYRTFGRGVAGDVLELYDAGRPAVLVAVLAMAAKVVATYPILLFCGRTAVDDLYSSRPGGGAPPSRAGGELRRRLVISSAWFCTTLGLACLVPSIGPVIRTIGSLAALFIFLFPGLCLVWTAGQTWTRLGMAVACVALGTFVFGQVLTASLLEAVLGTGPATELQLCRVPRLTRLV
ncbi:putative sodium-coupled neutral amino acid transporter 7 isoform X1 [Ixodes scapularis]|uniref:putative sodium-coupled neutral amino acid transporter 7 isoform X1 n=1 Tax=Ixodes scapularis TaxID=6945 RepID=UPI001A9F1B23|nr:putative sodium-coupled neutral amino acid transporter 7 isoform X1 [Ixodes scapularis]